ncbi:MAG: hypothetical protein Rhirs2KO_20460 [Rhizobiaceae bacterium]|jgi:hypothetical protein
MEKEFSLLWEVSAWEFVFVTVILAGGAAYLTGRALARTWQGATTLFLYMLLLTAATRFIHFALFSGTLLSLYYYIIDLIVITAIAFLGMRVTRAKQMATQYSFEYQRSGSMGWTKKN